MKSRKEILDESPRLAATLAFTVPEFCSAHGISRALFYILKREGNGPRVIKAGRRTLVSREGAEYAQSWLVAHPARNVARPIYAVW